jgi:hypothetical protein
MGAGAVQVFSINAHDIPTAQLDPGYPFNSFIPNQNGGQWVGDVEY